MNHTYSHAFRGLCGEWEKSKSNKMMKLFKLSFTFHWISFWWIFVWIIIAYIVTAKWTLYSSIIRALWFIFSLVVNWWSTIILAASCAIFPSVKLAQIHKTKHRAYALTYKRNSHCPHKWREQYINKYTNKQRNETIAKRDKQWWNSEWAAWLSMVQIR